MSKMTGIVCLLLVCAAASGCMLLRTVSPNSSAFARQKALYTPIKYCTSEALDVDIRLLGEIRNPEKELWTADALILIIVKQLNQVEPRELAPPITIAWFHFAERDLKTGEKIPRTFTDFPNVLKDRGLESGDGSSKTQDAEEVRRQYKQFLFSLIPDRPVDILTLYHVLLDIMNPYSSLIESCIYGF